MMLAAMRPATSQAGERACVPSPGAAAPLRTCTQAPPRTRVAAATRPPRHGDDKSGREREGGVATQERRKTKRPDKWKVILFNDDYTSMEFVVEILIQLFGKTPTAATEVMLRIHRGGKGVAGVYILEVAETKVATVHRLAEQRGYPLRAGLEQE
jgi:ATP-dependent Clp protease adaptor protein ClpS